jgi:V/A-type H+-transporting ATPase subunit D
MIYNIAATKTNLFKVKKTLTLTKEGHELLEEKRKILLAELTVAMHVVERIQAEADKALKEGYALLDKAIIVMGKKRLEELSLAVDMESSLSISSKRVMGISTPMIDLKITENPPYYSPHEVSFYIDDVILKFKDILKMLAQLAEKKIALLRLAREVQKTIRKVNALEKVYIPFYSENLKFISNRLDEEARESFSMLKLIKERLRK